ncbi:MAG: hypothetical protein AAB372_02755 [Patescibacteria group bacterium]
MVSNKNDISFAVSRSYPPRHKGVYVMSVLFFLMLGGGYIAFRSSSVFIAPTLELIEPQDGAKIGAQEILVSGLAEPKARIMINGMEAFSGDDGQFAVTVPVQEGYHIIDVRTKNRVGKEARVVRRIIVQ